MVAKASGNIPGNALYRIDASVLGGQKKMLGRLQQVVPTVNGLLLTLQIRGKPDIDYDEDTDLDIKISKHRKKRSLDQNAYFHKLIGEIAKAVGSSTTEIKNGMISRYGQINYVDGKVDWVLKPDAFKWERYELMHLKPSTHTIEEGGELMRVYIVMRGTHTYNSKEMSLIIDSVVMEAKELGIETLPPEVLARMREEAEKRERKNAGLGVAKPQR